MTWSAPIEAALCTFRVLHPGHLGADALASCTAWAAGQRRRLAQGTVVVTPYLLWKVTVIVPVGLCWQ